MTRRSALSITMLAMLTMASCSKEGTAPPAAPLQNPAAPPGDERVAKIPILPGYKYYAGGPAMVTDKYGQFRIAKFNGEVQQPPSRGLIFGAKIDGDKMEYQVWVNGVLLGLHRGTMRDGLYWQDYVEGYRNGKLVAREHNVNDDVAKVVKVTTEDIDPQTGEVIRTKETQRDYTPPQDEDDDDDEGTGAAPPAAPPAAPKDAAK